MNGQTLELTLPWERLPPADAAWHYFVDVSIRGRVFSAQPDEKGPVQIAFAGL
jgi:hypothetical protein